MARPSDGVTAFHVSSQACNDLRIAFTRRARRHGRHGVLALVAGRSDFRPSLLVRRFLTQT